MAKQSCRNAEMTNLSVYDLEVSFFRFQIWHNQDRFRPVEASGGVLGMSAIFDTGYVQTDLVSDIAGLATITDPELMNPFGFTSTSTSPFWISNNDDNTSTLYAVTDSTIVAKTNINPPSGFVAIPTTALGTASGNQGPTGVVANTNTLAFLVGDGGNGATAHFIFANDNGTISAWDTGPTAFIQVTTAGADYSGLAVNQAQTLLYAADTAGGSIHVFNSSFAPVSPGTGSLVAGAFATPAPILALGLNPFNVQDIHGSVYVTYALPGTPQNDAAPGEGAVAVFSESGTLLQTIVGGPLASPWGIALAPAGFGQFGGDLLVGNESYASSEINAFNPVTGAFEGTIPINVGSGNTAGGLWALGFGIGGSNGSPNTLYFTDGINQQADGLFGALTPLPPLQGLVTTEQQVEAMYVAYLGRAGDPGGVNYWEDNLQTGQTIDQVAMNFSKQVESENLYPFLASPNTDSDAARVSFIDAIYENLFNRMPDAPGLSYWNNELHNDQLTLSGNALSAAIGGFILEVIRGATNSLAGQDITTLQNRVTVASYFTEQLAANNISYANNLPAMVDAQAHDVVAHTDFTAASVIAEEAVVDADIFADISSGFSSQNEAAVSIVGSSTAQASHHTM
jgi:uncharacterized protein (TIGR03118 family)